MPKEKPSSTRDKIYLGVLLLAPIVLFAVPLRWITDAGPTLCLFKNLTGNACCGCGMTRAVFSLLHLQFATAWEYNRLVVIVVPVVTWLYIQEVRKITKRL